MCSQRLVLSANRRRFVQGLAALGGAGALGLGSARADIAGPATLRGERIDLVVGELPVNITGRARMATVVNGSLPAPILRLREGDTVTINVTNKLRESTSIHWHGLKLPNPMDGVPGLTFAGISPGETFTYRFPVKQSGTYWYHSHSGMQEQTGLYGPIILEPRSRESYQYDRDYVVLLSDWTDEDPMTIVSNLKQQGDYYNYHQRTLGTFIKDAQRQGLGPAIDDRLMWGGMRMSPTDIMDVTGATYTFLVNGQPPAANWTGLFKPGERVRLRFINSASMTTFDVRIPGLGLTVVNADGSDVEPIEVDEFRLGVAETYDVIVTPSEDKPYTIFAQAQDRSGFARATLATRSGVSGEIPPMDPPQLRTMADMGMGDMKGMDMKGTSGNDMQTMSTDGMSSMPGMDQGNAKDTAMPGMNGMSMPDTGSNSASMPGMKMDGMDMSGQASSGDMPGMQMNPPAATNMAPAKPVPVQNADGVAPASLKGNPQVDNVAMSTTNRAHEAGNGLEDNGRRVLRYAQLKARESMAGMAQPTRDIEFHLTGNMERWVWGFDGKRFSEAKPIPVKLGETVRFVLINDTMMEHPIHLHGFLFSVENGQGDAMPMKHTINVKPGERTSFIFTADEPGHWAFHCHLMFHMETGMFRTVLVS